MGRILATLEAKRSSRTPASFASSAILPRPSAPDDDTRGLQFLSAPARVPLALSTRTSGRQTMLRVAVAALGALVATLVAAWLLETYAVVATLVLLLAVMLGAWRGFWPGVTAALLTTAGLTLLLATADVPRAASVLDAGTFLAVAAMIIARCGWQERRAARLLSVALHDPLTGLPNRAALLEELERRCAATAAGGPGVALVSLDVDDFKSVNDRLGHGAGDELLCAVAGRLAARLRTGDLATRPGGDEFAALLASGTSVDDAVAVAARILAALDEPFLIRDRTIRVTASAGISQARGVDAAGGRLLEQADIALYRAKHSGKARAIAYRPEPFSIPQAHG